MTINDHRDKPLVRQLLECRLKLMQPVSEVTNLVGFRALSFLVQKDGLVALLNGQPMVLQVALSQN